MSLPPVAVAARRSGGGRNPEMWGCGTPGHRAYLLTTRTPVRLMFLCPNNQIATGPFHARGLSRAPKLGGNPSFPRRREPTPPTCAVGARLSQYPLRNRGLSAASLWHLCRKPVARIRASSYEAPQNAAVSNTFGENHRPPASSAKSWSGAATTLPARTSGRPTVSHFRPFKCPFRPVRLSRPSHPRPSSSYGMSTSGHE